MSKGLTKVSMNLSNKSIDNIDSIGNIINEGNMTRVIASSLEISNTILHHINDGCKLIIEHKDGSQVQMNFIIG